MITMYKYRLRLLLSQQQVSAAFDRMGDIKLVPKLKAWQSDRKGAAAGRGPRRKKRFEVREILLEDVCICVDAGVWNDLLGDQVGAAFSPEFRLRIKIGPQVPYLTSETVGLWTGSDLQIGGVYLC